MKLSTISILLLSQAAMALPLEFWYEYNLTEPNEWTFSRFEITTKDGLKFPSPEVCAEHRRNGNLDMVFMGYGAWERDGLDNFEELLKHYNDIGVDGRRNYDLRHYNAVTSKFGKRTGG